ncbi:MAG: ABC transporter permease [Chloroflexota bacterium]|nr:MAG: ABC transporter permease [Chloroflexota bacterium]
MATTSCRVDTLGDAGSIDTAEEALSRHNSLHRGGSHALGSAASLVCGMLVWELAGRLLDFGFLPPFSEVIRATWRLTLSGEIPLYLSTSLVSLAAGYVLAVGLGVSVGLLMGRFRTVEYLLDPCFSAFLAAPSLVYVPILFALFGASRLTQVSVVFIYAFFIVATNTMSGIRTVERAYVEMARSFGASELTLWHKVLLPGALPLITAGLHLGLGRGVKGMINGEMLIAFTGLGALLRRYGGRFDAAGVFGILIVVVGVALIGDFLLRRVERRLVCWPDLTAGGANELT